MAIEHCESLKTQKIVKFEQKQTKMLKIKRRLSVKDNASFASQSTAVTTATRAGRATVEPRINKPRRLGLATHKVRAAFNPEKVIVKNTSIVNFLN